MPRSKDLRLLNPTEEGVLSLAVGLPAPSSWFHLTSYFCVVCYAHNAVGVVGRSSDFSRTASAMSEAKKNKNNESELLAHQLLTNPVNCSLFLQPRSAIPMPEMPTMAPSLQPIWHMYSTRLCPALCHLEMANIGSQVVPSRMPPKDAQSESQCLLPGDMALGILVLVSVHSLPPLFTDLP